MWSLRCPEVAPEPAPGFRRREFERQRRGTSRSSRHARAHSDHPASRPSSRSSRSLLLSPRAHRQVHGQPRVFGRPDPVAPQRNVGLTSALPTLSLQACCLLPAACRQSHTHGHGQLPGQAGRRRRRRQCGGAGRRPRREGCQARWRVGSACICRLRAAGDASAAARAAAPGRAEAACAAQAHCGGGRGALQRGGHRGAGGAKDGICRAPHRWVWWPLGCWAEASRVEQASTWSH